MSSTTSITINEEGWMGQVPTEPIAMAANCRLRTGPGRIRVLQAIQVALLILLAALSAQAKTLADSPRILVIHSYHSGLSWTDSIMNGIRDTFTRSGCDIQYSAEYLDARRCTDPERAHRIRELVIEKLKEEAPDLVMVSDDAAFDFVLAQRNQYLRDIPIVFCGVQDIDPSLTAKFRGITGVAEEISIIETVGLAQRLHPETGEIIVIGRTSVRADKYNRDCFVAALPKLPPRLKVTFWDDLPLSELQTRLKNLKKGSLVILNGLIRDDAGHELMYGETTKWVCGHSTVPVYSFWDVYLGYGIVGGRLLSGHRQGQMAAELAVRILRGESADRLPVVGGKDANRITLDYEQLVKFKVPSVQIPEDAVLVNQPDSFYEKHKTIVWTTAAAVVMLSTLVILLAVTNVYRRRVTEALRRSEEALRQANLVVENSPVILFRWKAAEGWPVELVSRNISQFGYTADELLSGTVPFSSIVHPDDLERVSAEVAAFCAAGIDHFQQQYRIVTKQGEARWVIDHTIVNRGDSGKIAEFQGIVIDITERKLAEDALERRVLALTQPLGDTSEISFEDLFNLEDIQRLQDQFCDATGVASLVTRPDGTPITAPSNFCRFCLDIVRSTEKGRANCNTSDSTLGRYHPHGPVIQTCLSAGLAGAGASIQVGGKHIANWVIGQVRGLHQTEEQMRAYAREIEVDEEDFITAFEDVPIMSLQHFEKVARMLFTLASQLSTMAYQNVQQGRFITERKQAEAAAKEHRERLELALLGADLGSWDWNLQTKEVSFNDRWVQMLGYPVDEAEPRLPPWKELVHPDDMPRSLETLKAHLEGRTACVETEQRFRHKSGSWLWVLTKGKVITRDEAGRPVRIVGTHLDITERKLSEEAIRKSEAELRSLFEASPAGVALLSDRVFVKVNDALCRITGYSEQELIGKSSRILYPDDEEFIRAGRELYWQVTETGLGMVESRLKRKTGAIIVVLLCLAPLDPMNAAAGVTATVLDITERKRAEDALRKTEQRLRTLVENIPDGIARFDANGRHLFVNPAVAKACGVPPEDFIGKTISEIGPLENDAQFKMLEILIRRAFEEGVTNEIELEFTAPDGARYFHHLHVPEKDEKGKAVSVLGICRDITERKRAEEQLKASESILRSVFSATPIGLIFNRGRVVQNVNHSMCELTGYSEQELVGKSTRRFYETQEEYEYAGHALYSQIEQQGRTSVETRYIRKDGTIIHVSLTAAVLCNEDLSAGSIVTVQDITERKLAEEETRRLRNYLSNIINSMPSMLVGVDLEGRVTMWNTAAENQTGFSAQEARGQPVQQLLPLLSNHLDKVRGAINTRMVKAESKAPRIVAGQTRYEDMTVYPLVGNGVEGAVIRVDDVTERVRIDEVILESEKMLSVGRLAAGMAHEINNPLGVILQASQNVLRRVSPGIPANIRVAGECGITLGSLLEYMKQREILTFLEDIRQSGQRAAEIVANMLSFSRKAETGMSTTNLAELLDRTVSLAAGDYDMKKHYDFRQIEIVRDYEPDVPQVVCHAGKIQQVFLNILRNGAEAMGTTRDQGRSPRFILRVAGEGAVVRVEIEDNGDGMDESTRKRLFEPFFTTKPPGLGTGLGLSVSYFIITEDHQGAISVESTPGVGSCFIIRLRVDGGGRDAALQAHPRGR
ncbi:MAG: PAS domain S-box protein [Syntrophobacteraceae bacterium]